MAFMDAPRDATVRSPAVAGSFYPADVGECTAAAGQLMAVGRAAVSAGRVPAQPGIGAIVPHAGWICSGAIAAEAIAALAIARPKVDLVVIFGAIHTPIQIDRAVLDDFSTWATPGGISSVADLRGRLVDQAAKFVVDDRFHLREHAVEVELPLIQKTWPGVAILPVEVPPDQN